MKNKIAFSIFLSIALLLGTNICQGQGMAVNTTGSTADNSAMLDVKSTAKGALIPRMTQAQEAAISLPATGLMVYQTDGTAGIYTNQGTPASPSWTFVGPIASPITGSGTTNYLPKFTSPSSVGSSLIFDNGSNVGIGTTIPSSPLDVRSAVTTQTGYFENTSTAGTGLTAFNTAAAGAGAGTGVFGFTNQSGTFAAGVWGENDNAFGVGVVGINGAGTSSNVGIGVLGRSYQSNGGGVVGVNLNSSGTGIWGAGNNGTAYYLTTGSGGAFTGLTTGLYARNTSGGANTQSIYTSNTGVGVSVNYWDGTTVYKIFGGGTVSTNVKGADGTKRTLAAPECPEIYFQDYGQGQLQNGKAHIELEPTFAMNVTVNDKHPMRAFVQPEGDCMGVYITNKTATGFDVVELRGGTSNIPFQWSVTCNRADEDFGNGRISHNADFRFQKVVPMPQESEFKANAMNAGGKMQGGNEK